MSHESEVPAYIKKRQVPFFLPGKDHGNARGSRVDVFFVVFFVSGRLGKTSIGSCFSVSTVFYSQSKGQYWIYWNTIFETLSKTFDYSDETYGLWLQ